MITGGPAPDHLPPSDRRTWLVWLPLTSLALVAFVLLVGLSLLPLWAGVLLFALVVMLFAGWVGRRSRSHQHTVMSARKDEHHD